MNAYLYQPREVSIETLALCNAACEFCPYPTLDRKGAKIETWKLVSMVEEMRHWEYPFVISPFKVNEPFLDVRLLEFCATVNRQLPLARLRIFSNGSRFNVDNVEQLLALKRVEHIWVSLNAIGTEEYQKTMRYAAFNYVATRIDVLHKAWLKNRAHPVILSRVAEVDLATEIKKSAQFVSYCGDRWPGFMPFHIKRDAWIDFTQASSSVVPKTPCSRWWELSITATGEVALCCMDGEAAYKLGNVYEQSLLDIYNKPELVQRRQGLMARAGIDPCGRCSY